MPVIPIIAEVLDKEPPIAEIWIVFGSIALIGLVLCCYWRWWLAPGFLIVALIPAYLSFEEFSSVGLLSSTESPSYVAQFYVAVAAAIVLPIVGATINFKKARAI
jgi:hypothetical protein